MPVNYKSNCCAVAICMFNCIYFLNPMTIKISKNIFKLIHTISYKLDTPQKDLAKNQVLVIEK